jgi:hypothetical protein
MGNLKSSNHRYATEPGTFSLATTVTSQIYDRSGSLLSVDIQNHHADDDIQVLFGHNPWTLTFDETDDTVAIDTAAVNMATATRGHIRVGLRVDSTGTGDRTIFSISDANTETALWLRVDTNDKLTASLVIAGTVSWTVITDNAIDLDGLLIVKLLHNGTEPSIWIDGDQPAQTQSVTTDLLDWMDDLTGIDKGNIGCLDYNSAGNADFFKGEVDFVEVFTGHRGDTHSQAQSVLTNQWLFTEGTGTTIDDAVGTAANDGTVEGSAAWELRFTGLLLGNDSGRVYHRDDDADIKQGCWLYNPGANTVTGSFKIAYEQ